MYRNTVKIPVGIIEKANNEGWLNSISYLVTFKSLHKNNTFYNYSSRSLASKVRKSNSTVALHVKKLIEVGLAKIHNGNLCFLGEYKLQEYAKSNKLKSYMCRIPVVDEQRLATLKYFVISYSLHKQKVKLNQISETKKLIRIANTQERMHPTDAKRLIKLRKKLEHKLENYTSYVTLSAEGIAKKTGVHQTTAIRHRLIWSKIGLIENKPRFKYLWCGASLTEYTEYKRLLSMENPKLYNSISYSNGNIIQRLSNEIVPLKISYTNLKGIN